MGDLTAAGFLEDATSHEDELSLDVGETRHYQIRAYNAAYTQDGTADRSKDWVRRDNAMTQAAGNPGAPTGLTAVNTAVGAVSLFWYAPEDDGGWPISHYVIQVRRTVSGTAWKDLPDPGAATGFDSATDIRANASYNFRVAVAATNGVTQLELVDVPETYDADGPSATEGDDTVVGWEFRVYAETTDDGPDDGDSTDDNVIRRSTASPRSASVRAVARTFTDHDGDDPDGDGDKADGTTATIKVDELQAPMPTATGFDGRDPEKGQINLTIPVPNDLDVQNAYRIDVSDGGDTWKLLIDDTSYTGFGNAVGAAERVYEHVGLPYDAARSYRVFTVGTHWRTNVGLVSTEVKGTTAVSVEPGKVTGLMASSPDLMTIEASWSAPTENGGQPVTKYAYEYVIDDGDDIQDPGDFDLSGGSRVKISETTDDASVMEIIKRTTAQGVLAKEKLYHIRVKAVNQTNGDGMDRLSTMWSNVASFTTGEPAAPNMVEGLTSQVALDTSGNVAGVLLIWNKPTAGADVGNYVIERSMDGGTTWESPTTDAATSTRARTSYTDPRHYVPGETLAYRVAAKNDAGQGEPVTVNYPRDLADDHMHPPTTAALTAPTGVTATSDTDGEVTVMWMGADNADRYFIIALERGSSPLVIGYARAASGASETTITGLNSDMIHLVIVLALKGTGADREIEYGINTVTVQ